MRLLTVIFFFVLFFASHYVTAQDQLLIFQKNRKMVSSYSTGMYICFIDHNNQWQYGILKRIRDDSFYIRPYLLQRSIWGFDTLSYYTESYTIADVFAMPKSGIEIDDVRGERNHQIATDAGHVHFYWIKGGWLFRVLGAGYAGLNIFNSLVLKNQPIDWLGLACAAGLFAFGEFLKLNYKPYLKLGHKYSLKVY